MVEISIGMVRLALAWSGWLWHGQVGFGMVGLALAWSDCLKQKKTRKKKRERLEHKRALPKQV
jgi:hypothetical protein